MVAFVVVLVLVLVVVGAVVGMYNRLVRARNQAEERWAQIDVELRRRHDLIPNLVETVRGYATHERDVLTRVTEARAAAVAAGGVGEQSRAEGALTSALRSLFAVAEAYPRLAADANFRELQEELATTEARIAGARRAYNDAVRRYDTARETFPTNVVAGAFGFAPRAYFEIEDPDAREPVTVEF